MKKPREYETLKLTMDEMTFLFPEEVIHRLEGIAHLCGIDLENAPLDYPVLQDDPDILEDLLDCYLANDKEPLHARYARLPKNHREYMVFLIRYALDAALELRETQPDTPLAFLKGDKKGMLSNLLSATWMDLTLGGRLKVNWRLKN